MSFGFGKGVRPKPIKPKFFGFYVVANNRKKIIPFSNFSTEVLHGSSRRARSSHFDDVEDIDTDQDDLDQETTRLKHNQLKYSQLRHGQLRHSQLRHSRLRPTLNNDQ